MNPLMKLPIWILTAALATAVGFGADIDDLMAEAQRAYIRNDLKGAKENFELVRQLDPSNGTAISYLRRILAEEKQKGGGSRNATQEALQKLIMEKVDFRDASLPEVLEFLKQKGTQLSGGKVAINFVLPQDENIQNAKVSLTLQKIPFSEVLRYVGELTGTQFVYEPFAIVVKPKAAVVPAASGAETSGGVKKPGL